MTDRSTSIEPVVARVSPPANWTASRVFVGYRRDVPHLPTYETPDVALVELGQSMIQPLEDELDTALGEPDDAENTSQLGSGELRLPASYTDFAQFAAHDITFDPASSLTRQTDSDALDFRSPASDLDDLYGRGPSDQPCLYDSDGVYLTLCENVSQTETIKGPDLLRLPSGRSALGDPRDDKDPNCFPTPSRHVWLSQRCPRPRGSGTTQLVKGRCFKRAQQAVRLHYQWILVHDFLWRLVCEEAVEEILGAEDYLSSLGQTGQSARPDLRFYVWEETPYMPVEVPVVAISTGTP